MMKSSRKFPYFTGYLEVMNQEAERELVSSIPPGAWLSGIGFAAGALLVLGLISGSWVVGAATAAIGALGLIIGLTNAHRKRRLREDPREQRRQQVFKVAKELRELEVHRKLNKWMDPVALHLLEAGAYNWTRIMKTLDSPQWSPRDLPAYWVQIKQQVQLAAAEGMADLVLLTRSCVGPPQKDRQDDIKNIFESFVDLDIADALQGMKQMASSDWTAYAHQSPQAQAISQHGRLIAERLKDLADDVEAKASEIAVSSSTMTGLQSLEALDGVLGELRSVRQAEDEVQQRLNS